MTREDVGELKGGDMEAHPTKDIGYTLPSGELRDRERTFVSRTVLKNLGAGLLHGRGYRGDS